MLPTSAPTSQKYRPISFVLDYFGSPIWVPLVIRPEDLTRSEPSRMTVHQTLGKQTVGWVDSFGPGLPTISIAGHTGWRAPVGGSDDGAAQFVRLHDTVFDLWHKGRQAAIDIGQDPTKVKLLFVDDLDAFAWEVAPISFVLRRSKSRPLLMQYNIQLQAVSLTPEVPFQSLASIGDIFSGLGALGSAMRSIFNLVGKVVGGIKKFIGGIASAVNGFLKVFNQVLNAVKTVVGAVVNGVRSIANGIIGIARSMAAAGRNLFQTIAAIRSIPTEFRQAFSQMAAAFAEVFCIFGNSLKAKGKQFQDYSDVYGASNCSSTTGGRPESAYLESSAFNAIRQERQPVVLSSEAAASLTVLAKNDPVLSPMSTAELGRHAGNISTGYAGLDPVFVADVAKTTGATL